MWYLICFTGGAFMGLFFMALIAGGASADKQMNEIFENKKRG